MAQVLEAAITVGVVPAVHLRVVVDPVVEAVGCQETAITVPVAMGVVVIIEDPLGEEEEVIE